MSVTVVQIHVGTGAVSDSIINLCPPLLGVGRLTLQLDMICFNTHRRPTLS